MRHAARQARRRAARAPRSGWRCRARCRPARRRRAHRARWRGCGWASSERGSTTRMRRWWRRVGARWRCLSTAARRRGPAAARAPLGRLCVGGRWAPCGDAWTWRRRSWSWRAWLWQGSSRVLLRVSTRARLQVVELTVPELELARVAHVVTIGSEMALAHRPATALPALRRQCAPVPCHYDLKGKYGCMCALSSSRDHPYAQATALPSLARHTRAGAQMGHPAMRLSRASRHGWMRAAPRVGRCARFDAARRARGRMNKDIRINLDVSKQFTATDYLQARPPGHALPPSRARPWPARPPGRRTLAQGPVASADQPTDAGSPQRLFGFVIAARRLYCPCLHACRAFIWSFHLVESTMGRPAPIPQPSRNNEDFNTNPNLYGCTAARRPRRCARARSCTAGAPSGRPTCWSRRPRPSPRPSSSARAAAPPPYSRAQRKAAPLCVMSLDTAGDCMRPFHGRR
jgi:hypothetical protein